MLFSKGQKIAYQLKTY